MYAGGIRSLLLQTLHPAAMAGVAGHSGSRSDPWGRLQRTSEFIAMTTYGPIPSALALIERVKAVHELLAVLDRFRPELRASAAARNTVEFLLRQPPIPRPARPGYWMLAAGAIATLPRWARAELGLPTSPWFDRLVGLPCGRFATAVVRWSLTPESRSGRWADPA